MFEQTSNALRTGHSGKLFTVHFNGPFELETSQFELET